MTTTITEAPRYFFDSEIRSEYGGRRLSGYAVKYNSPSLDLGGFIEKVAPDAFRDVLADREHEVFAVVDHDMARVLARRTVGTLHLSSDRVGLRFEFNAPATTLGNDVLENVRNGNYRGMSFRFPKGVEDSWHMVNGQRVRTLHRAGLKEITVTAVPAYPETSVGLRSQSGAALVTPAEADAARRYYEQRVEELDFYRRHPAMRIAKARLDGLGLGTNYGSR
jgi:HK97 family phage prohead protease